MSKLRHPVSSYNPVVAADFVKQFELGPKGENPPLKAYKCPAGAPTIGWGHTRGVRMDMVITKQLAERYLTNDLSDVSADLARYVSVPVSQNEYIALVDFVFNIGISRVKSSTMLKYLNQGKYDLAASQIKRWTYCNGEVLPGLVSRRKAETEKFLEED